RTDDGARVDADVERQLDLESGRLEHDAEERSAAPRIRGEGRLDGLGRGVASHHRESHTVAGLVGVDGGDGLGLDADRLAVDTDQAVAGTQNSRSRGAR